jgi:Cell division protein CrgA
MDPASSPPAAGPGTGASPAPAAGASPPPATGPGTGASPAPAAGISPPPATGPRRASPPWYGGLSAALMFGSFGWIIGYGLVPVPGLGGLGGWNYVIAAGEFLASVTMARLWRAG